MTPLLANVALCCDLNASLRVTRDKSTDDYVPLVGLVLQPLTMPWDHDLWLPPLRLLWLCDLSSFPW